MADYPLSTISSKKLKKSSHQVLQKSARHIQLPPPPQKAFYEHILRDERLFIELYYQGRIMETAYNQYVEFMGGILYKRLNPRVTIFLTNTDDQELDNILDRVKRTCPECRVVSILWFEESFQAKCKLPLDKYLLQKTSKSKDRAQGGKEEAKADALHLHPFLQNIAEDIELEFQDFFKKKDAKLFHYLQKNQAPERHWVLESKEFDLGPHPNKKKATKADSNEKKPKKNFRATAKFTIDKESLQIVETKSEERKKGSPKKQQPAHKLQELELQLQQRPNSKHQPIDIDELYDDGLQLRQNQNKEFNTMMEKYLNNATNSDRSISRPLSIGGPCTQLLSSKSKLSQFKKRSLHSQASMNSKIEYPTITPKYKDLKSSQSQRLKERLLEVEGLKLELAEEVANRLVVVSSSKSLLSKVQECNKQNETAKSLYFKYVDYFTYWALLQSSPACKYKAYYPLNEARPIDRPLYFAMRANFHSCPRLISSNVVGEVASFNKRAKDKDLDRLEVEKLHFLREMEMPVCVETIKQKRVAFMQSELSSQLNQLLVDRIGGFWVTALDFINNTTKVDLVVTSRGHLRKNGVVYLTEEELWARLFPLRSDEFALKNAASH